MKTDKLLNTDTEGVRLSNIVKAEARKATDTAVAKAVIWTTFFLTVPMFIVSIWRFKNKASWTYPFTSISNPATTLLGILFILLICEEWTRGTTLVTYTFVPQRNRVIAAKFIVLLIFFLGTTIILYALSAIASIIAGVVYSHSISWSVSIYSLGHLVLPLLVNMLFGFSMAIVAKETTTAIALYFVVPPITVIACQLPGIGSYFKWVSLEHSSSLFVAGATSVSTAQYICSLVVWIVIPCIIGCVHNMKCDIN